MFTKVLKILLTLIVVGGVLLVGLDLLGVQTFKIVSPLGRIVLSKPPKPTPTPEPGVIPTMPSITLTPNPGVNSLATVVAVMPTPHIVDGGKEDAEQLSLQLSKYWASKAFDYRVVGSFTSFGKGRYCEPLRDGERVIQGTEYGVFSIVETTLYGGVPQKSFLDEDNYEIVPVKQHLEQTTPLEAEWVNSAVITMTVEMGLLEPAHVPGRSIGYTIQEVAYNPVLEWIFNPLAEQLVGAPLYTLLRDKVNNLSRELAEWDGVAPLNSYGNRTTFKLDRLYEAVLLSLTTPSGDPTNPHAYDNLLREAELLAKEQGFLLVEKLTVIVKKPQGLSGYTYLEDGTRVVPPNIDAKFSASTCSSVPDKKFLLTLPEDWLKSIPPEVLVYMFESAP